MKCKHLTSYFQRISWNLFGHNDIITHTDKENYLIPSELFCILFILQIKKKILKYSGNFGINISKKGTKITTNAKIMNRLGTITGVHKVLLEELFCKDSGNLEWNVIFYFGPDKWWKIQSGRFRPFLPKVQAFSLLKFKRHPILRTESLGIELDILRFTHHFG